jgi:acetyl esterase/lipase
MRKIKLRFTLILCLLLASIVPYALAADNADATFTRRIDAELLPAFETLPPFNFSETGVESYVETFARLVDSPNLPQDPEVNVYNVTIPNGGKSDDLRLRVYEPEVKKGALAGIYWIHGGGFLFGVPEQDEAQSLRFAKEVGAVVVAVDYRLAPRHRYPVSLEDCYAGLVWFADNAKNLGVDKKRIAVAGASAGGNLCAAVTLLARDRNGPKLAFQMPLYPMLDDRFITPSSNEDIDARVWNPVANRYAWQAYIGDLVGTNAVTPYMAPARASDLSDLPPAYSCVGELDPFRDEVIDYMARLAQAGVPAELHLYPGGYHAFDAIAPDAEYSKRVVNEYVYVLQKALQPASNAREGGQ